MADELSLDSWLEPLIAKLNIRQRRQLLRKIGTEMRRRTAERIAAQRNPDATPFVPRKAQPAWRQKQGRIKRSAMFGRIRKPAFLKMQSTDNEAAVGFAGRTGRIAKAHQFGLRDKVSPNGKSYDYPKRELLGFGEHDRQWITNMIMDFLGNA